MSASRTAAYLGADVLEPLARWRRRALLAGAAGALVLVVGALFSLGQALRAYLFAYLFVLGPALGSLALVLLHNTTGGRWGVAIRRPLEAAMRTLPVLALGFLPIVLGMGELYPWADPDSLRADPLLRHKEPFLNPALFALGAGLVFGVWILFARGMDARPTPEEGRPDTYPTRRQRLFSGFGMAVFVVTLSFAAFQWAMSLEPHWFSTIYGLMYVVGYALAALALAIAVLTRVRPLREAADADVFHDLGNLTLALVMLWGYVALSQFLIIWSANLPEEVSWYVARSSEGWQSLAIVLVLLHFALPFTILLSRRAKRLPQVLGRVALFLVAMRFLDLYWVLAPAFHPDGLALSWLDPVALVAAAGLWSALYLHLLTRRPLVYRPVRLAEDELAGEPAS